MSISEVGECLVHLFTIVQVLGLVNFEAVVLSVYRKLEDGGRYRTWWPNIMKRPVFSHKLPSRELTYPPDKAYLTMMFFFFCRWDMLVSWRVLLVNLFPFKMHDSQIVGSQKVIMKPVVPYRTADASSFSPDFGTVWRLILHDFGISLESYPVMSWQSFFHGTRETKTTWCSLSLVKKVGRADGYLHLHLL